MIGSMRKLLTFFVLLVFGDLALTTNVYPDADRMASCLLGYTVSCSETRDSTSNEKQMKTKLMASSRFWGKRGGGKARDSVQRELLWSSHQWILPKNKLHNKAATKYTRNKIAELRQRLEFDSTTTSAPSTTTVAVTDAKTWTDRKRYMLIPYENTADVDDQLSVDPKIIYENTVLLPAGKDHDDRLDNLRRNLALSSRFWGK